MQLTSLLSHWRAEPTIGANIAEWRKLPARPAHSESFPPDLHPDLVQALRARGLRSLYIHQAVSWRHIKAGKNVVIATGTASGKTLCYNLPVIDRLLRGLERRALYLFPTKALAQDQLQDLKILLADTRSASPQVDSRLDVTKNQEPVTVSAYDGDTPTRNRPAIRDKARLVLSNPDMLHTGVLPHHTQWAIFFQNLDFVVIDELHIYRGVFGSHVANVIRRLKRIANFYGSQPQFILTSATISNPVEHAERLVEEEIVLVDEDGSARGPKHFLIYNPPVIDRDLGLRRSAILESVRLAEDLFDYNIQTIVFGRSRPTVEIILTYLRERVGSQPGLISSVDRPHSRKMQVNQEQIRGYRSGYLPGERRTIEHGLRNGQIRTVVATNALELGIDIGGLGAAVLAGYPGSIAAAWQQAGRAGRGNADSLAVLVATASPLDQFLALHPDYFFDRSPEQALINPDNLLILLGHLRCAAFELPFQAGEPFGHLPASQVQEFLQFLVETGELHFSGKKYFWMSDRYPSESLSLRSASAERVLLLKPDQDSWKTIGEVDLSSALWMVHPQAVYLHEGQPYLVESLDLDQRIAYMRPENIDYYTQPQSETTVQLLNVLGASQTTGGTKAYGDISVTTQVKGFRKVKWFTHEQLDYGELSLPSSELPTTGYWLALAETSVNSLRDSGLWRGDPNRYGSNWQLQAKRARARDGYLCQVCGAPEGERAHDVHHKIPFRTFTSFEQANQLSNLVTLCHNCHQRVEATVRMRSGLSGLAYALGNLAPIFLMCDDRDLGIHSDPKSPLADGNPAVILYDRVPAGIGFSQRLFELHDELIHSAYELVTACECNDGCPSCVGPGGENGSGGKKETLAILDVLGS